MTRAGDAACARLTEGPAIGGGHSTPDAAGLAYDAACEPPRLAKRRSATTVEVASTTPNGHAPDGKPHSDESAQPAAKARTSPPAAALEHVSEHHSAESDDAQGREPA